MTGDPDATVEQCVRKLFKLISKYLMQMIVVTCNIPLTTKRLYQYPNHHKYQTQITTSSHYIPIVANDEETNDEVDAILNHSFKTPTPSSLKPSILTMKTDKFFEYYGSTNTQTKLHIKSYVQ